MPIKRSELRSVIATACDRAETSEEEKARLVATAEGIDRVLVGDFSANIGGVNCGCPATLAGYFDPTSGHFVKGVSTQVEDFPVYFDTQFTNNPEWVEQGEGRYLVDNYNVLNQTEYVTVVDDA